MYNLYLTVIFYLSFLFATFNAQAGVIYEQLPGANSSNLYVSSTLNNLGQSPGFRVADDFTLSASEMITDVHWWGRPNSGGDNFLFSFYADGGGIPGSIMHTSGGSLSTTNVDVGSNFGPVNFYSSVLDSPFSANAGTTYWLSIFNQAQDASWQWLSANAPGNGSRQWLNSGSPTSSNQILNVAFQLTTVPEPSIFALLCIGAINLLAYNLQWRKFS